MKITIGDDHRGNRRRHNYCQCDMMVAISIQMMIITMLALIAIVTRIALLTMMIFMMGLVMPSARVAGTR